ncbi:MAG: ribonuclease III [bacterium]|nr:ribonuclease III [bacterium]
MDNNLEQKKLKFEKLLGVEFKDKNLLDLALTHKSYATEHRLNKLFNNERLEFLGDSVLSIIISTYLYFKYPNLKEGTMSKMRSVIVSKNTCYEWAKKLHIGEYLLLGKGEETSGGRNKVSTLGNAFESLIGAMYLDRGYSTVENFLTNKLLSCLDMSELEVDYKSKLQELIQKKHKSTPHYHVKDEGGPAHKKLFKVEVLMHEEVLGCGEGHSKKKAQQLAAKYALGVLDNF